MAVNLTFRNPAATGTILSLLTAGTYDHLRFSGATSGTAVASGSSQDTSWISDSAGIPAGAAGTSGALPNNKYISSSNIVINDNAGSQAYSGTLAALPANTVATAPDFDLRPSGTILIDLSSDDGSVFRTSNTLFYLDDGTTPATAPVGITAHAVEFNKNGEGSTTWTDVGGSGNQITLQEHSLGNGYAQATQHMFAIALSVVPTTSGTLESIRLSFSTDFGA
ncbi:MAG: hypothetical protein HOM01_15230 [Kordiimonadaceae bacterium]|jgi:hypothetical protein|nr:hypothetical protein [Kordiimonadaceae bacterium]